MKFDTALEQTDARLLALEIMQGGLGQPGPQARPHHGEIGSDRIGQPQRRDVGFEQPLLLFGNETEGDGLVIAAAGEQVACRVLVIGNVDGAPGKLVAANSVMQDQLDIAGARKAFAQAGVTLDKDGVVPEADRKRIAGVLVNAGADYVTNVRGRRHVLHSDFLTSFSGIQAKAVAHAIVASIVGDTMFLASAGAEHQGPPGANLVCVIAEAQ